VGISFPLSNTESELTTRLDRGNETLTLHFVPLRVTHKRRIDAGKETTGIAQFSVESRTSFRRTPSPREGQGVGSATINTAERREYSGRKCTDRQQMRIPYETHTNKKDSRKKLCCPNWSGRLDSKGFPKRESPRGATAKNQNTISPRNLNNKESSGAEQKDGRVDGGKEKEENGAAEAQGAFFEDGRRRNL